MSMNKIAAAVVVHGGAGAGRQYDDGCEQAMRAAIAKLSAGGDALEAAIAAVQAMEDDERFNAGTGAALGLDGKTIELDASVMDTKGRLGAVACLRAVKNPDLVARQVADTPHCLLGGPGAERFARLMGHAEYDNVTDKARKEHGEVMEKLGSSIPAMPGEDNQDFARYWNYAGSAPVAQASASDTARALVPDTVGAVVRDGEGHFAVASSTGGSAPSLLGRIGDTPLIGSGFYAGPCGAIAATGVGEHIIRNTLAMKVYNWIEAGMPLKEALARAVALIPDNVDVGLIGVTRTEQGACSNADMPQELAVVRQHRAMFSPQNGLTAHSHPYHDARDDAFAPKGRAR